MGVFPKNGAVKKTCLSPKVIATLRILGPSNGRFWTCIAGVRVLKIAIFEGSGVLGQSEKKIAKETPSVSEDNSEEPAYGAEH